MLKRFKEYIKSNDLWNAGDKILLAVSGGVDSMVMYSLMREAGYPVEVAHCNFMLRKDEAEKDEAFVAGQMQNDETRLHLKKFETEKVSKQLGISIQMAARELRYSWFEELLSTTSCRFIATAHHKNDVAETLLMNLSKGTGLAGLHGILNKSGNVVRPLLFATKSEIEGYAEEKNIPFRSDESNRELKYERNRIRKNILPELKKLNPGVVNALVKTSGILERTERIFLEKIEEEKKKAVKEYKGEAKIYLNKLAALREKEIYLYHWLQPYGFNPPQVADIVDSLEGQAGKKFFSPDHVLIKDRDCLILRPKSKGDESETEVLVERSVSDIVRPLNMKFRRLGKTEISEIPTGREVAFLDLDKLKFPLKLRKWKHGDYFYPLGMNKKKKLSDFFVDEKMSLFQKENQYLLTDAEDEIIWVIGRRIDERYKLEKDSGKVFFAKIAEF